MVNKSDLRFQRHASNLGRDDRALRGIFAVLLLSLSAFGVIFGQRLTLASFSFAVIGCYCAATAWRGHCWLYERTGFDTRSQEDRRAGKWRTYQDSVLEPEAPTARSAGIALLTTRQDSFDDASDERDDAPAVASAGSLWGRSLLGG